MAKRSADQVQEAVDCTLRARGRPGTGADLCQRQKCAWPVRIVVYLRSALSRANIRLGNGLADVRADPKDVLRRLDQLSPATLDMTSQSWANLMTSQSWATLKSRVRSALRYAAPYLAPARSRIRLECAWAALAAAAPRRERRFRFAEDKGWLPGDIGEPQLEQFEAHLEHEVIHSDSVQVVGTTANTTFSPRACWRMPGSRR